MGFLMTRPFIWLSSAVLVGLVLASCSGMRLNRTLSERDTDWVMYGGGPGRSNVRTNAVQPPFEFAWEYNAQAGVTATPLVRDQTMLVGTLHGELQAVDLRTGDRLGYVSVGAPVVGTPVLDGGRVILGVSGSQQSLMAIDIANGGRVWEVQAGPIESSLLLVDRYVYATTLRGEVRCVDKFTGEEVWKYVAGTRDRKEAFRSSPATDGTVLCFGSDERVVYGLQRTSGGLRWRTATKGSVFAAPLMTGGLAIVGDLAGTVYALDASTGGIRWTYETGSRVYAAAAGSGETVFVASADGVLHALDRSTGSARWTFAVGSAVGAAPFVAGDVVYVGSLNRRLYAVDAATGKERWRYEAEGRIRIPPILWGEYLIVTSEDKYITALKAMGS